MKLRLFLICAIIFLSGCTENAYVHYFYTPPRENIPLRPLKSLVGNILWHGNRTLPEIALTFDDGPSSKATPMILDILKANDVKVTFFVLGKFIEKNKDIITREAAEGHLIGNHTFSHASGLITDLRKIKRELSNTDDLIYRYTGQRTKYFRPPFGFENWRFLSEAELMDYTVVLWSVDVADWDKTRNSKDLISKIMKRTKNGSIILLHDGGSSREAVEHTLPIVINKLKQKGFKFVTIDEMIEHL